MSQSRARSRPVTNSPEDGEDRDSKVRRITTRDPALLLAHVAREGNAEPASALTNFKNIVVLGDSYSAHTGTGNWIDALLTALPNPARPLVHNFARPGDTADEDMADQVRRLFSKLPSANSVEGRSLIVIWFGINDCGVTDADDLPEVVEKVVDTMHDLFTKWKGRSFLIIDVPPMHRSPGGVALGLDDERYTAWNTELLAQVQQFAESTAQASVYVVSSFSIITDFLDHPSIYGLQDTIEALDDSGEISEDTDDNEDQRKVAMWEDHIHLSKAGHKAFADRLWEVLRG